MVNDGELIVLSGILSEGSRGCVGQDEYEQVAPLKPWIDEHLGIAARRSALVRGGHVGIGSSWIEGAPLTN